MATSGARERLAPIDGLRGVAAAMVVLFHVYLNTPQPDLGIVRAGFLSLQSGVDLFFVLSGFCLFYPYTRPGASFAWRAFSVRRARRIFPAYYAALCMTILLPFLIVPMARWAGLIATEAPWPAWEQLWTHLLLVHTLFPNTFLGLDSPMWSLGIEAQFYLLFPLAVWLARRFDWRGIGLLVGISLLYRLQVTATAHAHATGIYLGPMNMTIRVDANLFIGRWMEFGMGMWCALAVRRRAASGVLRQLEWPLLAVALLLYAAAQVYAGGGPDRWIPPWDDILFGSPFSIVLCISCSSGSSVGRLLSHRCLLWLGSISYSLYLVHLPILGGLKPSLMRLGYGGIASIAAVAAMGIPLSLAAAALFWHLFERPFLRSPVRQDVAQTPA